MDFISKSEAETLNIGYEFGKKLKKGDAICLYGDPGAGKSVFVRGIAKALGIEEYITSPTFTLVNEYESGSIPLYHFDAYRLSGATSAIDSGLDEYFDYDGICAVEWPENIMDIIPKTAYSVTISRNLDIDDDYRTISIEEG